MHKLSPQRFASLAHIMSPSILPRDDLDEALDVLSRLPQFEMPRLLREHIARLPGGLDQALMHRLYPSLRAVLSQHLLRGPLIDTTN